MKKIITISGLLLLSATIMTTSASAGATVATLGGAALTITNVTDAVATPGPSLTFNPSPGVSMSASTLPASYAISAANISAAEANRNEYGVWSGYGGYYQQVTPVVSGTPKLKTVDVSGYVTSGTTPFATPWVAIGGGS